MSLKARFNTLEVLSRAHKPDCTEAMNILLIVVGLSMFVLSLVALLGVMLMGTPL